MLDFIIFLLIIAAVVAVCSVRIVPQAMVYVVERFGGYHKTWETGVHFKVPFIDKIERKISIKEQVMDFAPQPVITKDNVTMQVDSIVFYNVTDAKLYCYGVERPILAIESLTATTLRNIIGDMELDRTRSSRDAINSQITIFLDQATDKWGIKVNRVELKNIIPPKEIQDAMEREMKAERERRESVLQAQGQKESSILVAEGEKESAILRATAQKEATILSAEAEKQASILRAEAVKEQKIRESQGEAEAIMTVQRATAESLMLLNQAAPSDRVLALKSFESMEKVADGNATKIIIPSQLQSMAGMATSLSEIMKTDDLNKG